MFNRPFEKYYKDIPLDTFLMTQFKYIRWFNARFILKKTSQVKFGIDGRQVRLRDENTFTKTPGFTV